MSAAAKAQVGIVDAESNGATLEEWLRAAGFSPHRVADLREPMDAFLVRWPCSVDFAAAKMPVVLLAERAAHLPPEVVRRVVEVVPLPDSNDVKSLLAWSSLLSGVLKQATGGRAEPMKAGSVVLETEELRQPAPAVIAVGISTGGPIALPQLFRSLRGMALPPIAIVQHIPANFLQVLADRLCHETGYRVEVARDGMTLAPGVAYFAPGDRHLRLMGEAGALRGKLTDEPPRRGHRPAAEVLFESCAELRLRGVGVIMTGMGQDGAQGLLRLRQLGWATIGQNEETCAIYGMPRAAKQIGAVEREVALADIGSWLSMLCRARRASPV